MDKITDLKAKRSKLLEELVRISQEIEAESNKSKEGETINENFESEV